MSRVLKVIALAVVALGVVLVVLIATLGRQGALELVFGPVDREDISFETLSPGDRPNRYLACPEDYCGAAPNRISPIFELPVEALRDRWMAMIATQPRVTEEAAKPGDLQFDFVQRSKVFSFPDTITVRFIPRGETGSSLAIFSRSHYGYDDFGANQKRVDAWLSALERAGE